MIRRLQKESRKIVKKKCEEKWLQQGMVLKEKKNKKDCYY